MWISLLVIILFVIAQRTQFVLPLSFLSSAFASWRDFLIGLKADQTLTLALIVVLPAFSAGWLLELLDFWILIVLSELILLIWVCGVSSWRKRLELILEGGESAQVLEAAEKLGVSPRETDLQTLDKALLNQTFERFFMVLFWYGLLGSIGILLVGLSLRTRKHLPATEALIALLAWAPVRLQLILVCLMSGKPLPTRLMERPDKDVESGEWLQRMLTRSTGDVHMTVAGLLNRMSTIERARLVWLALAIVLSLPGIH